MTLHVLLAAFYFWLFLRCIRTFKVFHLPDIPSRWLQVIFSVKVLCGLFLWAIYTYHYTYRGTSDAFRYYDDGMVLYQTLRTEPSVYFRFLFGWGIDDPALVTVHDQLRGWSSAYNYGLTNDNPSVIRLNMIVALFSFGYYHVHTLFFSFLSTLGLSYLYKAFHHVTDRNGRWIFIAVFCIPSLLFWGSGVLKEPMLILGVGLLAWGVTNIRELRSRQLLAILFGVALLIQVKVYVLLCLIPAISYFLVQRRSRSHPLVVFGGIHLIAFVLMVLSKFFYPAGGFLYVLEKKRVDFYNVAESHNSGSVVQIPEVESWGEMILRLPQNMIYSYFRPFVGEVSGLMAWAASIENLAVLLLMIYLMSAFKLMKKKELPIFLCCLSFVVALGSVIATCVPVFGAVVRYKIPALPFLVLMAILLSAKTIRK